MTNESLVCKAAAELALIASIDCPEAPSRKLRSRCEKRETEMMGKAAEFSVGHSSAQQLQEHRGYPSALDEFPYSETHDVGGNPPTLDSPLLRGDQLPYTTGPGVAAIVFAIEHMFATKVRPTELSECVGAWPSARSRVPTHATLGIMRNVGLLSDVAIARVARRW